MCVCVIEHTVLALKPTPSFRQKKKKWYFSIRNKIVIDADLSTSSFFFLNKHIWGNQPEKDRKGGELFLLNLLYFKEYK